MSDVAIRARDLGKQYRIGTAPPRYKSLRESLARAVAAPLRTLRDRAARRAGEHIWALRELSFEIAAGEVVGIIGRNGAGKSTLLKILARITEPSEGEARVRGRVGSLLEVGTGFHPELTGRENVYLNGAILGMTRREIERKFDEIVAFAEVEKFMETPVKHFSSGMYMRLAFAVAAHLEPEILLVDEVLAVGDAQFQRKCLGKMGDVARGGRTVLFVSHNMGAVGQLCQRGVVLEAGRTVFDGPARAAIDHYLSRSLAAAAPRWTRPHESGKPIYVLEAHTADASGRLRDRFDLNDRIFVHVRYRVAEKLRGANLALILKRNGTEIFCSFDTDAWPEKLEGRAPGDYAYAVEIPGRHLKAGTCGVTLGTGIINHEAFEMMRDVLSFQIEELSEDTSHRGYSEGRPGMVVAPVSWREG